MCSITLRQTQSGWSVGPRGGVRQGSVFSLDEVLECVVEFPLHSLCNIIFSFAIASAKSPISLSQKALPRF